MSKFSNASWIRFTNRLRGIEELSPAESEAIAARFGGPERQIIDVAFEDVGTVGGTAVDTVGTATAETVGGAAAESVAADVVGGAAAETIGGAAAESVAADVVGTAAANTVGGATLEATAGVGVGGPLNGMITSTASATGGTALATTGGTTLATTGAAGETALVTAGAAGETTLATTGAAGETALATTGAAGTSVLGTVAHAAPYLIIAAEVVGIGVTAYKIHELGKSYAADAAASQDEIDRYNADLRYMGELRNRGDN